MKSCYCPSCGTKQIYKMEVGQKAMGICPKCGKSLLFKRIDDLRFTVSVLSLKKSG